MRIIRRRGLPAGGFRGSFVRRTKVKPTNGRRAYVCAYLSYPGGEVRSKTSYVPR